MLLGVNSSTFFYETRSGRYPRSVFVSLAADVGPTVWSLSEPDGGDSVFDGACECHPAEHGHEFSDLEPLEHPRKPKLSDYHQNMNSTDIDAQMALFNEWNANKRSHFIREPRIRYRLDSCAYNGFQEVDTQDVYQLFYNLPQENCHYYQFYTQQQLVDIQDLIMSQLEKTDRLNAINMFESSMQHMGRLATETINFLSDECGKTPLLLFDVCCRPSKKKYQLQLCLNQMLQHKDIQDHTHSLLINQTVNGTNLYQETSYMGLIATALNQQAEEHGYCMDSLQRGLVPSPSQRYLQCNYYLHDCSTQMQQFSLSSDQFNYQQQIKLLNASLAIMSSVANNPAEVNLEEHLLTYDTQVEDFIRQLGTLQSVQTGTIEQFIQEENQQYLEYCREVDRHARLLSIRSDKGIVLSKTFPHIFNGKIAYRTDANLRYDLVNSPIIRKVLRSLRRELTEKQTANRISKYFIQCDREADEIIDYCGEVSDAYKGDWAWDDGAEWGFRTESSECE